MRSKHIFIGILMMLLVLSVSGATRAQDEDYNQLTFEERAKGTLVAIGSTEFAFRSVNDEGTYGSFEDLAKNLYIAHGYGYFNMVEGYELRFFMEPDKTGFTVIAIPTVDSDPPMEMYTIDETLVLQKLEPGEDPGNHTPNQPGEIRTRTDESPQLEAPESITVYFEPLDNWTHNLYARFIYIESMDKWYRARGSYF